MNPIKDAIETIEDYNELLPQDLERIMNAAIRKCDDPSVCRDFINTLCERENELQDERLIKVTQELEKALGNYFAAGCSLGIYLNHETEGYCDTVIFEEDTETFEIQATLYNMNEFNECIELPYAEPTTKQD